MTILKGASRATLDVSALITTIADYWTTVFPQVRRELRTWTNAAGHIADPERRHLALLTLSEEGSLAEGAAIFATLAPRRHRRDLIQLLVAWQVAYDYLDTLGESGGDAVLTGHAFYDPLLEALESPARGARDTFDESYLDALLSTSRLSFARLPAHDIVRPVARRATLRCIDGQVLTHATASHGAAHLKRWALAQGHGEHYYWWELAAGAISSLGVHALLASAALPITTESDALAVDAAYFPSICALSTLLDSVIDSGADEGTANHRPTNYYTSPAHARARIAAITSMASAAARAA